jgi:hypothetical protein
MKDYLRKVKLSESINAESIAISKDRYFADAYVIDLPLDSTPSHVWQDIFIREWKASRYLWDRKLFVVGDNLRLLTTKDDIEDKLDWVKQVIERTNASLDEYNREEEAREQQIEEEKRNRASEEEKTSIDMIRHNLRRTLGGL